MQLQSPAKINIGLRILGRRLDGYHDIEGIFAPISFADTISLDLAESSGSFSFEIHTNNLLTGQAREQFERASERGSLQDNTLFKALELMRPKMPPLHLGVHLDKRLPTGAGLGGGSSNAGVVLAFLRDRFELPVDFVHRAAIRTGADVPFFLLGKPAFASGTGDHLHPIDLVRGEGVLCMPEVFVSTAEAYRDLKRPLQGVGLPETRTSLERWQKAACDLWQDCAFLRNDFEEVVFRRHPVLQDIKKAFEEAGAFASMTGSGSAIYGLVRSGSDALLERMASRFADCRFQSFQF